MDIQAYIESGILELYVSDKLPENEAQEVYEYAQRYPEIQREIESIEASLITYFSTFTQEKSSQHLLTASLATIDNLSEEDVFPSPAFVPESSINTREDESKIKSLSPSSGNDSSNFWQFLLVASAVLLLISIITNVYLFNAYFIAQDNIASLEQKFEGELLAGQTYYRNLITDLTDTNTVEISLSPIDPQIPSEAVVYWNRFNNKVFVQILDLPEPTDNQQYQLWAIKPEDPTPTSVGVFDYTQLVQEQPILISGPIASFAISLEPKGGSDFPTMNQIYNMGEVKL